MNYREVIRENRFKTFIVLSLYLFIYLCLGMLLDIVIMNNGGFIESFNNLITLKSLPIATMSLLGFGLFSILISIFFFKRIQLSGENYIEITEKSTEYRNLYNIIEELKISAGMKYMPKIYLIDANYMNAFASGWSSSNTLVAITKGLYEKLSRDELSAVMAHELTHIRNEDIKLTLVVGVVTNIMLFTVDWFAFFFFRNNDSEGAKKARMILLILHFLLPLITMVIQMWLSRSREYMADAGAVELVRDPDAMINALKKISGDYESNSYKNDNNITRKAAYIYEKGDSFLSTHPSIKNRIKKLSVQR